MYAIAGVEGGNNDACDKNNTAAPNPEEDNRDADMTDDALDPPNDDASYLDKDSNVSDSGNSDDGNGATRANVDYSLLNSIAADITKNARPTGVGNNDDNNYEASTKGVEVENTGLGTEPAQVNVEPTDGPDDIRTT